MCSLLLKSSLRLLLLLLLASQGLCAESPKVLIFSHTNGPTGARHEAALLFSEKVAEYTHGSIEVRVFHSGQIANDPKAVELIKLGGIDFTVTSTGSYAPHLETLNLLFLPYLVDNFEDGWRLYDESPWVAQQFEDLRKQGIHILSVWEAGFRQFTTVDPLPNPTEARNEKMRVFPNESLRWMVESFNFNPVILPATEVYLAIQQGTVIGQENPVDTIYSLRFYEVAPHITLTSHIYSPIPFCIAESTWQKLTANEKAAVQRAAIEAGEYCRQSVLKAEQQQLQIMQDEGATVHEIDIEPFRSVARAVYEQAQLRYGEHVEALLADAQIVRDGSEFNSNETAISRVQEIALFPLSMVLFMIGYTALIAFGIYASSKSENPMIPEFEADEHPLLSWIGTLADWSLVWSGTIIVLLMFGNVLSRFLFKFDVAWTSELSVFLMVWAIFLGGVAATRRRTQMRVGEFIGLIPSKPRKWIAAFTHLVPIGILVLFIIQGIGIMRINMGQNLIALGWPVGWQYAAMPVGSLLILIYVARDFVETLNGKYDPGKIGDGAEV